MEQGRDRRAAERDGEGAVHRVGLTRHCLASGRIQLPFALSDAFPEGDLLAHDVDHDEVLLLESLPPRRLSGLRDYFERQELQVNDLLEFRLADGELRLACVRRARRAPREEREDRDARDAAPATGAAPARLAAGTADASDEVTHDRDRVIGRIGSVTVRRLGSGRFAPPPEAALRAAQPLVRAPSEEGPEGARDVQDPADAGADRVPHPSALHELPDRAGGEADRAGADDGSVAAAEGHEPAGRAEGGEDRATASVAPNAAEGLAADPIGAFGKTDDVGEDIGALLEVESVARAEAGRERVREDDLLDAGEARAHDRGGRERPMLRWLRRPGGAGERVQPRRPTPQRSPRSAGGEDGGARPLGADGAPAGVAPADAVRGDGVRSESVRAEATRVAPASRAPRGPRGGSDARRAPDAFGNGPAALAEDPGERQRAREEALSRAGDLRSRMVRWLLDPATPVIIQHEHVQERFGLDASVARDVLDGILDDPPPSLRLTAVREDVLRISRVTVQHEG